MRILIVANSSNHSIDPTLNLGLELAWRTDDEPTVLKVFEHKSDQQRNRANTSSDETGKNFDIPNLQTRVRFGHWSEEIIQETKKGGYDLVILGEKKTTGSFHLRQNSQAVQVAEHVPCSVLIVKGQTETVQRILLCDSGAAHLATLNRFTEKVKGIFTGHEDVTVLHVMSQISAGPGVPGKQLRADAKALIDEHSPEGNLLLQDIRVLEKTFPHPVPKIRHGLVLDEILKEAQNGNYDLIVIGAHRYEGLSGYLLDDLAHKLIIRLSRSVLVLK